MAGKGFGPAIVYESAAENRRQFKALGNAGKDLTKANRQVAKVVVTTSRGAASGAEQTSAVGAIAAAATQSAAAVTISSGKVPWALGAFMGSLQYPQFDTWIGSGWDLAEGTGPYAIKDAFSSSGRDQIMKSYQDNIVETLRAGGVDVN